MLNMFNHSVSPAALYSQTTAAAALAAVNACGSAVDGGSLAAQTALLASSTKVLNDGLAAAAEVSALVTKLGQLDSDLPASAKFAGKELKSAMATLRKACDATERSAPASQWTLPTYHDMLFHQD